ncbi:MAG: hypothetical protein NT076_03270 [Candidatus Pacearchaeota archaeon]|nr:hypothetical protein [Candidatus Pacearchaeota archaeon]
MVRVVKSKVKIKELPDKWKIVKKPEEAEVSEQEEQDENEEEQSLEQTSFMPRAKSFGLEAPVLEASSQTSQTQFPDARERKKENNNSETQVQYQTATVYNMPDYSPFQARTRQQTRTEPVIHPTLATSEASQRQTVRMQEWGEIAQARDRTAPRQDAVIGASQLEQDNKLLPFQQDSKYHPRKRTV